MNTGERPVGISTNASFSAVVDETCERLMDRQIKYSIRRIHEMESCLTALERELDEFLLLKNEK